MRIQRITQFLLCNLAMLAIAACGGADEEVTSTPEVVFVVVTATDEPAPEVDESVGENTLTPEVRTIQDLNMRGGDSTAYGIMTVIPGGTSVEVTGKNSSGNWYQVRYRDATGWISVAFTEGSVPDDIPVVQAPPPPSDSTASATATSAPSTGGNGGSGEDGGGNGNGGGGEGNGGAQVAPSDSDLIVEANIKNESSLHMGEISYPEGDTTDRVFVNVSGFDSVTTSGDVFFTLTCTGQGVENVEVTSPSTASGTPACNSGWTRFFTNVSDKQLITIKLNSGSNAYVNWTLLITANN